MRRARPVKGLMLQALLLAGLVAAPLGPLALFVPMRRHAAAPVNSWAARRAALPAWLRERRTTEYRRDRRSFAAGVATGGGVAVVGVVIAALARLLTGHPVQPPDLVGPAQGQTSAPASPSSSPSASPTPTTSPSPTPTTSCPSPTASPTLSPTASPTLSPTATPTGTPTTP